jgi:hypothetical protein
MFISLCFHPQSIAHFILRADADKAKPRSAPSAGSGAEKGEKGNGGVNKNMIYFNMKLTPEMQVTCDDVLCVTVTCDVWRVTCDVWRVTCDVWRVTCDVLRVMFDVWPLTPRITPSLQAINIEGKKKKRPELAQCYLTRCTDTENLKLGLLNVPHSVAFIDFCAVTFHNFLHTALGSPDAPPYVTPVSCTLILRVK